MGKFLDKAIEQAREAMPVEGRMYTLEFDCLHMATMAPDGSVSGGKAPDGFCDLCRATGGVHTMRMSRVEV